ncbi:hypothetical protein FPQ18DRAFT_362390 [Pyronema domesticum]|nr:hypothetical protein FPQ18DRAFT_362390 [Pyronema domesticum]
MWRVEGEERIRSESGVRDKGSGNCSEKYGPGRIYMALGGGVWDACSVLFYFAAILWQFRFFSLALYFATYLLGLACLFFFCFF